MNSGLRVNTTPKASRKGTPNKLSVAIPNKITLKPRINRGTYRLAGKSLQMTSNRNSPTCRDTINWGRLPGGDQTSGSRYYRPTYDESVLMDSLRGYFSNKIIDEDMIPASRISRYHENARNSTMNKSVAQRGRTERTRNTWATVQPMSIDPRRTMVAKNLITNQEHENQRLWGMIQDQ